MPVAEPKRDVLASLLETCGRKPLWIDLKARQLRITRFAYMPLAFVEVSRRISVELPARVLFKARPVSIAPSQPAIAAA